MTGNGILSPRNEYALDGRFQIHKACREGDIEALNQMLQQNQADGGSNAFTCADNFYGWMPIHWAAYHGQLACVRKLLTYASHKKSSSTQESFDESWNSLINIRATNFSQTPVHLAASGNHVECLKWLLDAGGSLHLVDALGETAAHKAARCAGTESLGLLAAYGINLNVTNNAGQTAADVAAVNGHHQCSAYLQRSQSSQTGGFTFCHLPTSQDAVHMETDQSNPRPAFISGAYGYDTSFGSNVRKRTSQGEAESTGKRSKQAWLNDDPTQDQQRSRASCSMTVATSWMSGHCLM